MHANTGRVEGTSYLSKGEGTRTKRLEVRKTCLKKEICRMELRDKQTIARSSIEGKAQATRAFPRITTKFEWTVENLGNASFCCLLCMDSSSSSRILTYCSFRFPWTSGWSTICTTCDMSVLSSRVSKAKRYLLNTPATRVYFNAHSQIIRQKSQLIRSV